MCGLAAKRSGEQTGTGSADVGLCVVLAPVEDVGGGPGLQLHTNDPAFGVGGVFVDHGSHPADFTGEKELACSIFGTRTGIYNTTFINWK